MKFQGISWEVPGRIALNVKSELPERFTRSSQEVRFDCENQSSRGSSIREKRTSRGSSRGSSVFSLFRKFDSLLLGKLPKISIIFCFNREDLAIFPRTSRVEIN